MITQKKCVITEIKSFSAFANNCASNFVTVVVIQFNMQTSMRYQYFQLNVAYPGQQQHSPIKYNGRTIAKARRPSQHAAGMSPGKFSPGAPFSPSGLNDNHNR